MAASRGKGKKRVVRSNRLEIGESDGSVASASGTRRSLRPRKMRKPPISPGFVHSDLSSDADLYVIASSSELSSAQVDHPSASSDSEGSKLGTVKRSRAPTSGSEDLTLAPRERNVQLREYEGYVSLLHSLCYTDDASYLLVEEIALDRRKPRQSQKAQAKPANSSTNRKGKSKANEPSIRAAEAPGDASRDATGDQAELVFGPGARVAGQMVHDMIEAHLRLRHTRTDSSQYPSPDNVSRPTGTDSVATRYDPVSLLVPWLSGNVLSNHATLWPALPSEDESAPPPTALIDEEVDALINQEYRALCETKLNGDHRRNADDGLDTVPEPDEEDRLIIQKKARSLLDTILEALLCREKRQDEKIFARERKYGNWQDVFLACIQSTRPDADRTNVEGIHLPKDIDDSRLEVEWLQRAFRRVAPLCQASSAA